MYVVRLTVSNATLQENISYSLQCPKFPIACPNKCESGGGPRDDIEECVKICPLELIQCKYHGLGCEERMAHKDQKKHN